MCISPSYTIPANVPSYIRNGITNHYIFTEISDPMNEDTDGDGIEDKDDSDRLKEGLEGGIIGKMTIVSSTYNNVAGHAFMVYKSYIDDTLDFTGFYRGFELGTWERQEPKLYDIKANEKVSIGNAGDTQDHKFLAKLVYGGIYYNREVKNAFTSDTKYDKNAYLSKNITRNQLNTVISTHNANNDYNLFIDNCAMVAFRAWNVTFKDSSNDILSKVPSANNMFIEIEPGTPAKLKTVILEKDESKKEYNLEKEFSFINN